MNPTESRIAGFYRLTVAERQALLAARAQMPVLELSSMLGCGGLTPDIANTCVENAIGTYALPLGLALNFRINNVNRLVPMVVEEPSVIAAASNAARLARKSGGFFATMIETWMTGQIEVREVNNASESIQHLRAAKEHILAIANSHASGLVSRGGGAKDIEVRDLGNGRLVLHVYVDCRDAMGANMVNTIAEAIGPHVARVARGRMGLRILTNLCDRRRVRAECRIAVSDLVTTKAGAIAEANTSSSGLDVAVAIEEASNFAAIDPYRAVTHNKGIMNGIDSVAIATGNDFRAVEAGAHAWAAMSGHYRPLAQWHTENNFDRST